MLEALIPFVSWSACLFVTYAPLFALWHNSPMKTFEDGAAQRPAAQAGWIYVAVQLVKFLTLATFVPHTTSLTRFQPLIELTHCAVTLIDIGALYLFFTRLAIDTLNRLPIIVRLLATVHGYSVADALLRYFVPLWVAHQPKVAAFQHANLQLALSAPMQILAHVALVVGTWLLTRTNLTQRMRVWVCATLTAYALMPSLVKWADLELFAASSVDSKMSHSWMVQAVRFFLSMMLAVAGVALYTVYDSQSSTPSGSRRSSTSTGTVATSKTNGLSASSKQRSSRSRKTVS